MSMPFPTSLQLTQDHTSILSSQYYDHQLFTRNLFTFCNTIVFNVLRLFINWSSYIVTTENSDLIITAGILNFMVYATSIKEINIYKKGK